MAWNALLITAKVSAHMAAGNSVFVLRCRFYGPFFCNETKKESHNFNPLAVALCGPNCFFRDLENSENKTEKTKYSKHKSVQD